MREHGKELVLASVGFAQCFFGAFQVGDIGQDAERPDGPPIDVVVKAAVALNPADRAGRPDDR